VEHKEYAGKTGNKRRRKGNGLMNIYEFMLEIERTCPNLKGKFEDELHMAIGAATETGELLDAYKKAFAYGKPIDKVNVAEEVGDTLWYLVNLIRMLELDPGDVMEMCVAKLRARYPEKFTEENALNRDLGRERTVLETGIKGNVGVS
jgi:NTP pyrophosphatase (non-canonical NTP hydrolase)